MKVLVVYSSLSGNTKKVAQALYDGLEVEDKKLADIKDNPSFEEYDIIAVGYWVDKAGPCEAAKEYMMKIKNKSVFVFATLSFKADSEHAFKSITNGVKVVEENNEVIGHFICSGKLSESLIARFRKADPKTDHHAMTKEKEIRLEITKSHPTKEEMALGSQRLNERIEIYRRLKELK